jgi:hypothetical protein
VDGVPSSVLYTTDLSRGSADVLAGERSSLSPRSLVWRQQSIRHSQSYIILPFHIFGPRRLRLLPLGLRDAALDTEGGAVGARDTKGGGVASYLGVVRRCLRDRVVVG